MLLTYWVSMFFSSGPIHCVVMYHVLFRRTEAWMVHMFVRFYFKLDIFQHKLVFFFKYLLACW